MLVFTIGAVQTAELPWIYFLALPKMFNAGDPSHTSLSLFLSVSPSHFLSLSLSLSLSVSLCLSLSLSSPC